MGSELTIVISALNEEKSVKKVLEKIEIIFKKYKICGDIVFLNNHSTDDTGKIADSFAEKKENIKVIHRRNRKNKDLGSSLREGLSNANGKYILIMDCDLSHDPSEIKKLFDNRKEADIIIGSRFAGGSAEMNLKRTILSKTYNVLVDKVLFLEVKDITTGFKLYKKEVIKNLSLKNNGFGLHVEILLKASNKGFKIKEIPIHYRKSYSESSLNYRKQFFSYVKPVLSAINQKYFAWFKN